MKKKGEDKKKKAQKNEVKKLKDEIKSLETQIKSIEWERDVYKAILQTNNVLSVPTPKRYIL